MHVSEEVRVDLASYKLKDVSNDWVVMWEKSRGENEAPMTWLEFQSAFLDRFSLLEMTEAKVEEFMNLR